jgi:IclR family KDG regulon transcriptional repressor
LDISTLAAAKSAVTGRQDVAVDMVKSSGRTIQILELFADLRRDATIGEVSGTLGYPHSSTAAILHTLTRMGYMVFNKHSRTYRPAVSLALLGAWVDERVVHGGPIPALMEAVSAQTNDIVLLGCQNGLHVKFIHVVQPAAQTQHWPIGTILPLLDTGAGPILVSGLRDAEIKRIALRSAASKISSQVGPNELVRQVEAFRASGFTLTSTPVTSVSVLSVAVPETSSDVPLVLCLGGPDKELRARSRELLLLLQSEMRAHLGANIYSTALLTGGAARAA